MKQTKILSFYCKSLRDAEKEQTKLYNIYNYVKLISYPLFSDNGIYQFKVILS